MILSERVSQLTTQIGQAETRMRAIGKPIPDRPSPGGDSLTAQIAVLESHLASLNRHITPGLVAGASAIVADLLSPDSMTIGQLHTAITDTESELMAAGIDFEAVSLRGKTASQLTEQLSTLRKLLPGAVTAPQRPASAAATPAPKSDKARMPRAEFDKLTHAERNAFIAQGGKLIDDAAAPSAPTITHAEFREKQSGPAMTRADFDTLTHPERNAFMRQGGRLVETNAGANLTAAQYRAQGPPVMTRADFDQLNHTERNAYIRKGGKLTD